MGTRLSAWLLTPLAVLPLTGGSLRRRRRSFWGPTARCCSVLSGRLSGQITNSGSCLLWKRRAQKNNARTPKCTSAIRAEKSLNYSLRRRRMKAIRPKPPTRRGRDAGTGTTVALNSPRAPDSEKLTNRESPFAPSKSSTVNSFGVLLLDVSDSLLPVTSNFATRVVPENRLTNVSSAVSSKKTYRGKCFL